MINVFLAFAFLASAITANKIILYILSPSLLVGIRMLAGGLILLVYTSLHPKRRLTWSSLQAYALILLVVTLTTTLIPSQLKAYALQKMPSSKAAFFGTLDPFVTALYAYFLFGEKLTLKKTLGILLGATGTIILLLSTTPIEEHLKALSFISYPELAALCAIAISRFGWIIIQKFVRENIYSPAQINTITMILSGIISLSLAFFTQNFLSGPLAKPEIPLLSYPPFNLLNAPVTLLFFLAYTTLVGNVFGYTLYASILKHYSATFIALTGFSIPLLVALYGALFLGESLTPPFFIACAVTFYGMWIFFLEERRPR
jgi:drug/metabolite transporter (DMT)-like permease